MIQQYERRNDLMDEIAEVKQDDNSYNRPDCESEPWLYLCAEQESTPDKPDLPLWARAMLLLVGIVLILGLIMLPSMLEVKAAYRHGLRLEAQKKYVSAETIYKKLLRKDPRFTKALGRLFIVQYHNARFHEAYASYDKLVGSGLNDNETLAEIKAIKENLNKWYEVSDDLAKVFETSSGVGARELAETLQKYVDANPSEVYAATALANSYYQLNDYDKSRTIMERVYAENPEFVEGAMFLAAIFREEQQYDKAESILQSILKQNVEYAEAYAALSRIRLKQYKDKEALDESKRAYETEPENAYVLASLALAYHFNNMPKERDKTYDMFKRVNNSSSDDRATLEKIFIDNFKWR